MKPPICAICDKEFIDSDEAELVYFEKRRGDKKWLQIMREESMTGHPPFADWFCDKHYEAAKELKKMTITEAMEILNEKFKKS